MTRVLLGVVVCALAAGRAAADDPPVPVGPVATFVVEDGWVNLRIEKGGKPVPGGQLKVLVGSRLWAEGDTGDEGRGTFPVPPGGFCQLVFEFGPDPSAPIPLSFPPDGTVSPPSATVRGVIPACCRPSPPPAAPEDTPPADAGPDVTRVATGAGLLVGVVGIGCLVRTGRRRRNTRTHNGDRLDA